MFPFPGKPKDFNDVTVQDGINSEELKDAISDSDLKGLKQIRTELDAQDMQTAMQYFGKEGAQKEGGQTNEKPPPQVSPTVPQFLLTVGWVSGTGIPCIDPACFTFAEIFSHN